jgi:WhiB family transcriptional regulator, redox-sensing transcriptional regulator
MRLDALIRSTAWMAEAACAGADQALFFPTRGESAAAGIAICATCNVTAECLAYAIANREAWGTYGGISARERRVLIRKSRH